MTEFRRLKTNRTNCHGWKKQCWVSGSTTTKYTAKEAAALHVPWDGELKTLDRYQEATPCLCRFCILSQSICYQSPTMAKHDTREFYADPVQQLLITVSAWFITKFHTFRNTKGSKDHVIHINDFKMFCKPKSFHILILLPIYKNWLMFLYTHFRDYYNLTDAMTLRPGSTQWCIMIGHGVMP